MERIQIDEVGRVNGMFRMDELSENGEEQFITGKELKRFIQAHETRIPRYKKLMNQYLTKPPILEGKREEDWKPDNRIPVNFAKYLVDTFNGFFVGIPMRASHKEEDVDDFIKEFWRHNAMDNVLNETAKMTSIYGHGYWYLYQNEDALTEVAYNDPLGMFIIYTMGIRPKALYGVRYTKTKNGTYIGQLFTDEREYNFRIKDGDLLLRDSQKEEGLKGEEHLFGRVPIIEVLENEERQSLIQPVEEMINQLNKTLSEKANDVSYFADAYMFINGMKVDEDSMQEVRRNKLINTYGKGSENVDAKYLSKPDADQTQENLLDRLERYIFQTSMVVNLNDDAIGNSGDSGVALERKEQPMNHMALNKERKYTQALQTMFYMIMRIPNNVSNVYRDGYINILYDWKRNLPANKSTEAETAKKLDGIVSRRKQLEMLSAVSDVEEELGRIKEEASGYQEVVVDSKSN